MNIPLKMYGNTGQSRDISSIELYIHSSNFYIISFTPFMKVLRGTTLKFKPTFRHISLFCRHLFTEIKHLQLLLDAILVFMQSQYTSRRNVGLTFLKEDLRANTSE